MTTTDIQQIFNKSKQGQVRLKISLKNGKVISGYTGAPQGTGDWTVYPDPKLHDKPVGSVNIYEVQKIDII